MKVQTWESGMGKKYLFVNMVLVSSTNLDLLKKSQKDSCAVCLTELGINAVVASCRGCTRSAVVLRAHCVQTHG